MTDTDRHPGTAGAGDEAEEGGARRLAKTATGAAAAPAFPAEKFIEPLSAPLRTCVTAMLADTAAIGRRIAAELRAQIPEYGALSDPAILADIEASVRLNAELWLSALESGQPTPETLIEEAARYAQRRVHQGIPLPALLRAYRVGSGSLWAQLLRAVGTAHELYPELVHKVSPYLLYHFDAVAQAVTRAYADEQLHGALWRERLRHELASVVMSCPDDEAAFLHYTRALALDPSAAYVALSLALDPGWSLGVAPQPALTAAIEAWTRMLGHAPEQTLPAVLYGHPLIWLPVPHGQSPVVQEQTLTRAAERALAEVRTIQAIGIGLPGVGSRGWASSAEQSHRALRLGERLGPGRVRRYASVALEDAVMQSAGIATYLEAVLEHLSKEPNLLETLEAFFELRQHRKAVAARLNIHPNTLNYRLQRIESLLGVDLADDAAQAQLSVALRLRHLGRPGG